MENKKNIENKVEEKTTKNKFSKKTKIIVSIIILLISLAGLTKAGFIPNFTDSELLCPGEEKNNKLLPVYPNGTNNNSGGGIDLKPVIYLYPTQKQKIKVKLDYKGEIIADYPEYDYKIKGWEVEAYPDSKVIDLRDGKEYSYLFWEGVPEKKIDWDLTKGFIVEGKNAREFLQEKLSKMGLTPKEYNEFIVYWYPLMMNNKYNLIHFAKEKYLENAPLEITPKPDSILRVFMVMKGLDKKIEIEEQKIEKFERKGFVVVEWGGSELK